MEDGYFWHWEERKGTAWFIYSHPFPRRRKTSAEEIGDTIEMRSQVFSLSANTSFLRQALPLLVKPYKTILSPTALTSASASQSLLCNIPLLTPINLFPSSSLRNFTSRATHVNDAGSVDLPLIQSMHNKVFFPTHN